MAGGDINRHTIKPHTRPITRPDGCAARVGRNIDLIVEIRVIDHNLRWVYSDNGT